MPRIIEAFAQFFDSLGNPLIAGYLQFTTSGTNTDKDTYSDVSEATPNTNPLILDGSGRCPDVFGTGSYRVTSYNSNDVQIQQFDPVAGSFGVGAFDDWNNESIYSVTDIVQGSNNLYYQSLINSNQANDPITDTTNWIRIEFIEYWNTNKTYIANNRVRITDGRIFTCLVGNSAKAPEINSVEWRSDSIRTWDAAEEFAQYEVVKYTDGSLWRSLIADNLNNNPTTDDGTKWLNVSTPPSIPYTGGGTLIAYQINELQDGNTYTLPAADSVPAGGWVIAELPDTYSASTPTVQRAGADTITDIDGSDTNVLFDTAASVSVRFVSDGSSDWHI